MIKPAFIKTYDSLVPLEEKKEKTYLKKKNYKVSLDKKIKSQRRSSHGREEDGILIALKVEEEAGNQGGQVASRNWKRQGNILP